MVSCGIAPLFLGKKVGKILVPFGISFIAGGGGGIGGRGGGGAGGGAGGVGCACGI